MLSQFWLVVLDSGYIYIYIFFISLLTAWKNFKFLYVVWQIRILKSASLSLWPCSSSNGGGMHSTGFPGFGALRAMFLKLPAEVAALVVNHGIGMLLLVLLVFSHFALRSRRLPAGVSIARCALLGLWRDENCGGPAVAVRLGLSSSWTRLLMCPLFLRQVQFLGKVVDTPLCSTTGVMVQTVQFLDKFVALPVVFTTVALGSRRSENVWRCRRCSSACCGRLCDHATPMWC